MRTQASAAVVLLHRVMGIVLLLCSVTLAAASGACMMVLQHTQTRLGHVMVMGVGSTMHLSDTMTLMLLTPLTCHFLGSCRLSLGSRLSHGQRLALSVATSCPNEALNEAAGTSRSLVVYADEAHWCVRHQEPRVLLRSGSASAACALACFKQKLPCRAVVVGASLMLPRWECR